MLEWAAFVGIGIAGIAGLAVVAFAMDAWDRRVKQRAKAEAQDPSKKALAVLMERYAAGEIDQDEFLARRGYIQLAAEEFKRGLPR